MDTDTEQTTMLTSSFSAATEANTGSSAGLEVTAETENEIAAGRVYQVRSYEKNESQPVPPIDEAEGPSQAGTTTPASPLFREQLTEWVELDDTGDGKSLRANRVARRPVPASRPAGPTGSRKTSVPMLRGGSVLCVLGGQSREYGSLTLDDVCDVVFLPFYVLATGGDTLLNDSHATMRQVLELAAKSIKTTYGIHVPHRKLNQVKADLRRKKVGRKMQDYWAEKNIYHYAVLDLQVKPNESRASDIVGRVFEILKMFRKIQEKISLEASRSSSEGRPDAYIILGIHPLAGKNGQLFKALRKHLRSFAISCLIARTHLTNHEAPTQRSGCKTSGPAPYKVDSDERIMGMANTVAYARKSLRHPTPLAVSFTLCARWYRTKAELLIGADCLPDTGTLASRSSGTLCSENPELLRNQAIDITQHTAYSWQKPDVMITYDTADTIWWKVCSLFREHRSSNLAVALFDVECDDWSNKCMRATTSHLKGAERTRSLRSYLRELHHRDWKSSGASCP